MMGQVRELWEKVLSLFCKRTLNSEFNEELSAHIEMAVEDNIRTGMNPEEARRSALIRLGGADQTCEVHRDAQGFGWLADLQRNFRHSFRRLARSPLLSLVVILSLGLGIGANTAIFSVMHQILLRTLPVEKPEELAMVVNTGPIMGGQWMSQSGGPEYVFSYPGFRKLERQQQPNLAELAGYRYIFTKIAYGNQLTQGQILTVSGGYFPLMRLRPLLGRTLIPADDQGGGNPVAMLTYNFWKNKLGGRMDILNRPIQLSGQTFTIVGVAPRGFYGTTIELPPDVIIPLAKAISISSRGMPPITENTFCWIYLVARIKPGVTRERAAAGYSGAYAAIVEDQIQAEKSRFKSNGLWKPGIEELYRKRKINFVDGRRGYSMIQDEGKTTLFILMAATGMVLLIAAANAANLMLARSAARRGELAVCAAMGASRGKIAGQLLSEAMILAIAGGIAGITISLVSMHLLVVLLAPTISSLDFLTMQLEWMVLLYGLGLSVFTGLLFGLYPALEAAKAAPIKVLCQNSVPVSEALGAARVRKTLVCAQVMLSATLLIPTGLLLKSLVMLMKVDLGLRVENLITFSLHPSEAGYKPEQSRALFERVEQEVGAIPGITGVTSAVGPLLSGHDVQTSLTVKDYSGPAISKYSEIAPGFFSQMGIPLITGREFTERDNLSGQNVAIVNEQFAKVFFAEQNPVGRKIGLPGPSGPDNPIPTEIVGLVKDCHYSSVRQTPPKLFYLPWRQHKEAGPFMPIGSMTYYVRSNLRSDQVMAQVRKLMHTLDANLPPMDLRTMEDQVRLSIYDDRLIFQLAGTFAALATALAMMGLYGVIAYSVIRRTREIGIRVAIGAKPAVIRQMILREMMFILAVGLVLGIPAALAVSKVVNDKLFSIKTFDSSVMRDVAMSRFFGVTPYDPIVVAGASLALALAAFAAAYLPAWRASRVDPLNALRCE